MPARSLMAFWATIAIPNQPAYLRWHNAEHIPERLSIPGFLHARRYRSVTTPARFLMFYETAGPEVLTSAAYLAALNRPTERTRQALPWFEAPLRNAYDGLASWGARPARVAPIVVTCLIPPGVPLPSSAALRAAGAADRGAADGTPADVAAALRPFAAAADVVDGRPFGVQRARLYRLEPAGSGVRTREASIHGAASNDDGGLLLVESDDLRLLDDGAAWAAVDRMLARWLRSLGIDGSEPAAVHVIDFDRDAAR